MINTVTLIIMLLLLVAVAYVGGNTTWLPLNVVATVAAIVGLLALSNYAAEEHLIRSTPLVVKIGITYAAYLGIGVVAWLIGFSKNKRLQR